MEVGAFQEFFQEGATDAPLAPVINTAVCSSGFNTGCFIGTSLSRSSISIQKEGRGLSTIIRSTSRMVRKH